MKYITLVLFSLLFLASCGKQEISSVLDTSNQETQSQEKAMIESIESAAPQDEQIDNSSEAMMAEVEKEKMMQEGEEAMMEKTQEDDAMMEEKKMEDSQMMEEKEVMQEESAGVYTAYSDSLVGKTENTVIFFHATWCPSCRALDAGINSGTLPAGLTVLKADFDSQTELKKKYGVVSQHTLVYVDAQGNEIKKWAGGSTIESITEKLN